MPTVQEAYDAFVDAKSLETAAQTMRWYRWHLDQFARRMGKLAVDGVLAADVRAYLNDLRDSKAVKGSRVSGDKLSDETVRGAYRALRTFFNWAINEYDLDYKSNPMRKVRLKLAAESKPKYVTLDDVRLLLEATRPTKEGIRDRAIILFMIETGCRSQGLRNLKASDLDLVAKRAVVTEKGDRTRTVPFTPLTAQFIAEWMAVRPADAETVFCRMGTDPKHIGKPLSAKGLHELMQRLARRAGVERFNPHSFRHGAAFAFLNNGGNIAALQKMLGHSSPLVTIKFYGRHSVDDVANVQMRVSPVADLLKDNKERG